MKKLILISLLSFAVNSQAVQEAEITQCQSDSDCIVVQYNHCCGSTKKAINKKYLEVYNKNKSWQKFDKPGTCAMIGRCLPDDDVKKASCEAERCQLRFPATRN